jgi:hypothetical protein
MKTRHISTSLCAILLLSLQPAVGQKKEPAASLPPGMSQPGKPGTPGTPTDPAKPEPANPEPTETDLEPSKIEDKTLPDLPETRPYETSETGDVAYVTPYKPKALGNIPPRWRVEEVPKILIANNSVKLDNGTTTALKVNAYKIVPNAEAGVVSFKEPTFDATLGTKQKNTITASLTRMCEFLQTEELAMEKSLSQMEETIVIAAERAQKLQEQKIRDDASKAPIPPPRAEPAPEPAKKAKKK